MKALADLDATCGHGNCERQGTYRLRGRCSNCGWDGVVICTKGHAAPTRGECPRCEVKSVTTSGWVGP